MMTQPTSSPASSNKDARREARKLREAARTAFEAGDYMLARSLHERVVRLVPGLDLAQDSQNALLQFQIDPWAVRFGLLAAALYGAAWLIALP